MSSYLTLSINRLKCITSGIEPEIKGNFVLGNSLVLNYPKAIFHENYTLSLYIDIAFCLIAFINKNILHIFV